MIYLSYVRTISGLKSQRSEQSNLGTQTGDEKEGHPRGERKPACCVVITLPERLVLCDEGCCVDFPRKNQRRGW